MKKILVYIIALISIVACQPDEIPSIGEPTDYKPMLTGTWQITSFIQVDVDAESKSFPAFATEKDLTNVFPEHSYTDFKITFNADGTFTTEIGSSYMDLMASGSWSFDDEKYPSAIILVNGDETQTIGLGSLADVVLGKMSFKEERKQKDTGKVKIRYTYNLEKN